MIAHLDPIGHGLTEAGLWRIQPEGNAVRLISKVDQGRGIARDGIDHDVALSPIQSRTTLWLARDIPLGRLGRPDDIADACVFLASNASSYVTGDSIRVMGGRVIG